MDSVNYRKFLYFHGLDTTIKGSELQGDCPLCGKEQKFYMSLKDGQWNCKVCQESGNAHSFLSKVYDASSATVEDYTYLSTHRGIKGSTFRHLGLRRSAVSDEWVWPAWGASDDKLKNLYRVDETKEKGKVKFVVMSSPAPCTHQLLNQETLKGRKTVYICEGHWDMAAWLEVLLHLDEKDGALIERKTPNFKNKLLDSVAVVGVPGAGVFNDKWVKLLRGKDVIFLFDNDEPGQKGVKRTLKILEESGIHIPSVQILKWRMGDPNDIRDILLEHSHYETYQFVRERLHEVKLEEESDDDTVDPIPCETFTQLKDHYKKELLLSPEIEDTLATMLAVIISTEAEGGQLGLRIIGPPGSAKSTLAEAASLSKELTYPRSKFTGLVSGWGPLNKKEQLAAKIDKKCLIIKDADTMIQLPNLPQVESELRDAMGDGVIRTEYLTGKVIIIHTRFTVIMCGTKVLRQMDSSILGSRFVDIVIHDTKRDSHDIVLKAVNSQFQALCRSLAGKEKKEEEDSKLKKSINVIGPPTIGFLQHKKHQAFEKGVELIEIPEQRKECILAMGEFVSYCRADVSRDIKGDLRFRPEKELSTRLGETFMRLAFFLAIVLSNNPKKVIVTQRVISILQRICRDTSYGFHYEIIEQLANSREGMNKQQLALALHLEPGQTYKKVCDMQELKIISYRAINNVHGGGHKANYFQLSPIVLKCYKAAFAKG